MFLSSGTNRTHLLTTATKSCLFKVNSGIREQLDSITLSGPPSCRNNMVVVVVEMIAITSRRCCTRFQPLTAAEGINNRTQVAADAADDDRSLSLQIHASINNKDLIIIPSPPPPPLFMPSTRPLKREMT